VLSFERMIYKHAHKIVLMHAHLENDHLDDLYQVGNESVIKAARSYRNVQSDRNHFASYAFLIIKSDHWKYVKRSYLVDAKLDGISRKSSKKLFFKISTLLDITTDCDQESRESKRAEFSNKIKIPIEDIIEAEARVRMMGATEEVNEDILAGAEEDNSIANLDYQLLKCEIDKAICELSEDEKVILECRFFASEPLTIRKLGPKLGVHYSTIPSRTKNALSSLKRILESNSIIQELAA